MLVSVLQIVFSNHLYESTAKWESCQIFRGQFVGAHLAAASAMKMGTLLGVSRAPVARVMVIYTSWEDIII